MKAPGLWLPPLPGGMLVYRSLPPLRLRIFVRFPNRLHTWLEKRRQEENSFDGKLRGKINAPSGSGLLTFSFHYKSLCANLDRSGIIKRKKMRENKWIEPNLEENFFLISFFVFFIFWEWLLPWGVNIPASTVLIRLHFAKVCLFVVVESNVKFPLKYNGGNVLHLNLLSFIKTN